MPQGCWFETKLYVYASSSPLGGASEVTHRVYIPPLPPRPPPAHAPQEHRARLPPVSPVPLDRLGGREAAQLQQAAARKGLTGRDKAGAGSAVPLRGNLRTPEGSVGTEVSKSTAGSVSCQAECPDRQPCLQARAHGLCPGLCPDSLRRQARAAAAGLRLPSELRREPGAQHSLAGVSIPEKPRRAACPGGELSERRCSPAAGC